MLAKFAAQTPAECRRMSLDQKDDFEPQIIKFWFSSKIY